MFLYNHNNYVSDVQWNRDMISSTDRKRQSEEDDATDVDAYSDWSPGSKKSCLDAPPLYDLSRTLNKIHKTFMEVCAVTRIFIP